MSGIPQSKKLWITPLSPVHMGTDEDYTPTGYVIEGNALHEFDQRALANLPRLERQSLDKMLSGKASQDMLKQVQAFFHRNREWLIPAAVNVVRVSDEMAQLYNSRVGKAANIETGGKQVINALEIERAAYNPQDRRLFFPGSGLKGAMRTALLDAINDGQRAQHREKNRDLQQRLFKGAFDKDPMRLVQVGDCSWRGSEAINSAEVLFAVNRKKHAVTKNGKEVRSQAEQRNLYQLLECASPFRFRAYQGLLNISNLTDFNDPQGKLPEFKFSFGEIATACNRFYRPIFDREIELLRKRGYLDSEWRATIEHVLGNPEVKRRLESNDAFLLRVGRHSGAESVTLNGVRSIKIMKGKGEKPAWEAEAKTTWLATGSKGDKRYLRPFGWLLLEMTDLDEQPPRWQEAETLMEQKNATMEEWLRQVQQQQIEFARKVAAQKQKSEQQAREAEEQAAEQARLAAEKEARLAAMSPLERDIEEICEREKSNNPGAILLNKLKENTWENSADQRTVAEKVRTLWKQEGKWNPDFSGTNKQKVKQKNRCLEVRAYLNDD